MKTKINIENWNRKEHFDFFSQMEEPFHGITVTIDCTLAYQKAKEQGISFFIYYLHKTLKTVNAIENFRYRIIDKELYCYDKINASTTVIRSDKTFGFSLIEFKEDIHVFNEMAQKEIERIQNTSGLFTRDFSETNLIHFSALPWINFTSLSHARGFSYPDSCPKISFGKLIDQDNKKTMPLSIHVHHGLIDGYHVGLFLEKFEEYMNN
ncbi:chloramphenicol acetyltransferase [Flavobacterium oreochromis]|uniref:Chloramphenicol acetyltransferase n=2 Tax=Flavobacterium TaxID=237 RepID=A0A246GAW7_9FLAO|nr:chloramphenicol acetyltransferase [Flavobacterium oreochromis]OWP74472.1 chloramphenicol acetyltransferase [Flavobacterium oreochromis]OWP77326.1 chloramphenicol acetyltransferase [Flavobacterium oreochromis]POR22650.1 chloramphenicol acetyltransferase [Flavobacterium columnare]QYS87378.1 chloramphenicol acetyltransferase [Flavobacterium oreochromis]